MNGFILILSVVWQFTQGGPTGGAAANYTTATFADESACKKAGEAARAMVYREFARGAKTPHVNFICVPQVSKSE
ncbi:hypothetical protein AWB81_01837 [Caballeronia arationis]|uniref:hypothetical protein n=1 Tax=Caballeronia arationis TaxID=1777142 RepID=UPI00074C2762|nr:hypothetical protein [Caballeronia arationis]SAK59392.1 hypothetical protein AWB81_01837 [Caballeronia arationis]